MISRDKLRLTLGLGAAIGVIVIGGSMAGVATGAQGGGCGAMDEDVTAEESALRGPEKTVVKKNTTVSDSDGGQQEPPPPTICPKGMAPDRDTGECVKYGWSVPEKLSNLGSKAKGLEYVSGPDLHWSGEELVWFAFAIGHQENAKRHVKAVSYTLGQGIGLSWNLTKLGVDLMSETNLTPMDPRVVASDKGDALFVWYTQDTTNKKGDLFARYYDAKAGTVYPTHTVEGGKDDAQAFDLAMDGDGNATIAWVQANALDNPTPWAEQTLKAAFFSFSGSWSFNQKIMTAHLLHTFNHISLASSPSGNSVLLWEQKSNGTDEAPTLNAKVHLAGTEWPANKNVEPAISGPALGFDSCVDDSGRTVALWQDGGNLWANVYHPQSGVWGVPHLLDKGLEPVSVFPQSYAASVGCDGKIAWAIWRRGREIKVRRYHSGSWFLTEPPILFPLGTSIKDVDLALTTASDSQPGRAFIATTSKYDGVITRSVRHWNPGPSWFKGAWSEATVLAALKEEEANIQSAKIAVSKGGRAMDIWVKKDKGTSTFNLWGSVYAP
jgi:hypothetical protein